MSTANSNIADMRQILLYCFLMICCACNYSNEQNDKPEVAAENNAPETATLIKTAKARYGNFNYSIQGSGKISAHYNQTVNALIDGRVMRSDAINGRVFSRNAAVVMLDTRSIINKLNKSNEDLFNAKINYKSNLISQASLLENKRQGIRDTVFRKMNFDAGVTSAEFEVKQLKADLENAAVRAPFDGKVANTKVQKDMFVRTGQELFTIYSHHDLFIEMPILESDIGVLKIGQHADVYPLSLDRKYNATVSEINPLVDDGGMTLVRLKLSEAEELLPGMNCKVNINLTTNKCLTVPKEAIVMRAGKEVVFTNQGGNAKWNFVITGRDNGEEIEIKDGLKKDDEVIISNNIQLSQNSPVKTK